MATAVQSNIPLFLMAIMVGNGANAGSLSPFGEDHSFPLPVEALRYAHPTDKPNRAGVQVVEGR